MKQLLVLIGFSLLMAACKKGFEPINYGKDACAHCKMTIVDDRYGAELLTAKGRAYKFDDVQCLRAYANENKQDNAALFVEDYLKQQAQPLDATSVIYLQHEFFTSPMNGNYAAFKNEAEAKHLMDSLKVPAVRWEDL